MTTTIVLEREFVQPITPDYLAGAATGLRWCLDAYRVSPVVSYLRRDGLHCTCIFAAPDFEAMLSVMRQAELTEPGRMWPATLHLAQADQPESWPLPPQPGFELSLVERSFPQPVTFEEIDAIESGNPSCMTLHRVRFVRSYFSLDRMRMLCLYEAPDAEAVRNANQQIGLPFDAAWTAQVVRSLGAMSVAAESGR